MTEKNSYWERYWRKRLTRRSLLRGTALSAAGLAAAAVVGCGEGEEAATPTPAATTPAAASPATTPTPAPTPKQGGTFRISNSSDMASFDPNRSTGGGTLSPLDHVYSRLVTIKSGPGAPPLATEVEPSVAKSWEASPDGLVYTFKLREDVKFHPPLNRLLTADDVIFSFRRFRGEIPGTPPAAEAQRLDIVESAEKVDDFTVRFTLTEPWAPFVTSLVSMHTLILFPQEFGTTVDPDRGEAVGTGPWLFEERVTGSVVKFRRNPEWFGGPERPYLDRVEQFIIPESATALTQFLAGNLDRFEVASRDVKRVLDTMPDVQLSIHQGVSGAPLGVIALDGNNPAAPWRDPRVGQALSMAIDRDAMLEAAYDFEGLKALGIDIKPKWANFMPVAYEDYWLDPKGDQIKPEYARIFKYDPEGAKNLLAEAGYPDGFSAKFHSVVQFPPDYQTISELFVQYLSRIGVNLTLVAADYNADYATRIRKGDFDGLAHIIAGGEIEPSAFLAQQYIKGSARNNSRVDDPVLEEQLRAILANPNPEERRQKVLELQNGYLPEKMYYIPVPTRSGPNIWAYPSYMRGVLDYYSTIPSGEIEGSRNYPYYWRADI